jgi:hypothetical protein
MGGNVGVHVYGVGTRWEYMGKGVLWDMGRKRSLLRFLRFPWHHSWVSNTDLQWVWFLSEPQNWQAISRFQGN